MWESTHTHSVIIFVIVFKPHSSKHAEMLVEYVIIQEQSARCGWSQQQFIIQAAQAIKTSAKQF